MTTSDEITIEEVTDLAAPIAIRRAVFVEEQGVSEAEEMDGRDPLCLHWLLRDAQGPVATLRVRPLAVDIAKIQRVAVLRRARGRGQGAALMRHVMAALRARGFVRATLGAQLDALAFYEKLGFAARGPIFADAGIPHREMARDL